MDPENMMVPHRNRKSCCEKSQFPALSLDSHVFAIFTSGVENHSAGCFFFFVHLRNKCLPNKISHAD